MTPPKVTHLTNRILNGPHIQYARAPGNELSSWMSDELLVSADASPAEKRRLDHFGWHQSSSVLAEAKIAERQGIEDSTTATRRDVKDIEIWRPKDPPRFQKVETVIADLTHDFGKTLRVSPNHILVPCGAGAYCPASAPTALAPQPTRAKAMAEFEPGSDVQVVVIDTGYIKPTLPLEERRKHGGFADTTGQVFDGNAWVASQADGPRRLGGPDSPLDLLDGHGTFTAGEIAERCPKVQITVVGILDPRVGAMTEAAVARAIYENSNADVIVPVFAFHPLNSILNWTFPNVLPQLKPGSVVVCPAGNESSSVPHYPAALPWPYFPVVGVGSFVREQTTQTTGVTLSDFSNYGHWVFGYHDGEDVPGLYFDLTTKVEDGPNRPIRYRGWARWSGTSFAAPQVAAKIANQMVTGISPKAAAAQLQASAPQVQLITTSGPFPQTGRDLR